MIKKILQRRAWIKLLRILRGHRRLKNTNSMGRINALKSELASTPCIENGVYSKRIFGAEVERAELIIRQLLLARIEAAIFAKELLYSVGKSEAAITYPLPPVWRKVVIRHGFKVARIRGVMSWNAFVIMKFGSGIFSFVGKIFKDIVQRNRQNGPPIGNYIYFDTLSHRNFPTNSSNGVMHNIFTWYLQWEGKATDFNSLCHDVRGIEKENVEDIAVLPISSVIPVLANVKDIINLTMWGLITILSAIVDLIRGYWWHALMFGESCKARVISMVHDDQLAKDYLFHNSGWIYRPLWTYEAVKRGSRILFYYYSTNIEGFKQSDGYLPAYFGWKTSTWDNHLVWDSEQEDFVHRSLDKKVKTYVVGPIWFESGLDELPELPSDSIAVFDVQPVRDALYNTFGIPFDYFVPANCNPFLEDIYSALRATNHSLALKRKRNIGRLIHYRYQNLLHELENDRGFISLDPDMRAQQIIRHCKAVISMPFTAPALIAKQMGKPTVYYDPNGLIQKDDRGAHGIQIICGRQELIAWLDDL